MVKNKMRFTLIILLMLLAGSCGRKPELPPLSSGINPIFCPRGCEHMYVHAFDGDDEDAAFFFDGDLWMIMSRPEEIIAVPTEDFFLRIDMSSYTVESACRQYRAARWFLLPEGEPVGGWVMAADCRSALWIQIISRNIQSSTNRHKSGPGTRFHQLYYPIYHS